MRGDITKQKVDAIVNAANHTLLGGGGVDGAIHRAAGPELLAECRTLGGCPTGSARITGGYELPARHVIHTVGPVYRDGQGGEPDLLASCYRSSLELASESDCATVAFPALSCGAYGYPLEEAAQVALTTVIEFLQESDRPEKVTFVLFDKATYTAFATVWDELRQASG
jgi:O-acetyl-ADP-ribose deacetylase (regulator of RNase III)